MQILYAVCATAVTVSVIFAVVELIATLRQMRATAKSVELLAQNANDRLHSAKGLFDTVDIISNSVRSIWFKLGKLAVELIGKYRREIPCCEENETD
ncbi:MAG: hypothetical protein NTW04_05040 [Elusimicrobia bacterium]|nr:hypothetical protein [Elusimicrobiota bacterium]